MNNSITYFKNIYSDDDDFIIREIHNKKNTIYLLFFESLVDSKNVYDYIIKYIYLNNKNLNLQNLLCGPNQKKLKSLDEVFFYIENGFTAIICDSDIYVIETKANIDRGITQSTTEPNMYGPKDSLCENYQKNLGLIKRRIKSSYLKVDSLTLGEYSKTKVSLVYMSNSLNKKTLEYYRKKISNIKEDIIDNNNILKYIERNRLFPTTLRTERPSCISKYLLKGYLIVLIDNTPFCLILDAKLKDFINPEINDLFVKALRIISFLLTILTPAIYISLICYNQESIPTSLLINFMYQRFGVPFPAIIEALIMLFICEILREADVRFPNNYGSAASILGALILGDAAVQAGIVSPIMIIIIAITFITNLLFTQIKFVSAIRILRISFLLSAAFFGLYGVALLIVLSIGYMTNIELDEGAYL